jgi:hypothetical protein
MLQPAFQPSARARSWVDDRDVPDHLVARDPLLTLADKQWVLRHRLDAPRVRNAPEELHA